MLTCATCGKQNQDNYKFCLGCGARLGTPGASKPDAIGSPSLAAPSAVPPGEAAAVPQAVPRVGTPISPAVLPSPAVGGGPCPACGQQNPPGFRYCGACGASLTEASVAAPAALEEDDTADDAGRRGLHERPTAPAIANTAATRARLVLLREDGSEGGQLGLEGGPEVLGRDYGPPFDNDAYLDPRHAALTVAHEGVRVDDFDSLNGVFVKLEGRVELRDGDQFRVGQELILYQDLPEPALSADGSEQMGSPNPGYWGRISVIISPGQTCAAYPIKERGLVIGREAGDARFPEDGYVSGRHCAVVGDDSGVYLEDLGSSNGTYVRVRTGDTVPFGSLVLFGQQLFRVERG
ncbi:MAG: FHA domain-containing protein [Myxococcales bacterium FL481]|nr:MAG: FHA domain-containing protein [Myxococcales bacterium FL481]